MIRSNSEKRNNFVNNYNIRYIATQVCIWRWCFNSHIHTTCANSCHFKLYAASNTCMLLSVLYCTQTFMNTCICMNVLRTGNVLHAFWCTHPYTYQGFIQDFEIEGGNWKSVHWDWGGVLWQVPPGNFGKIDALRLILRHSRGNSSHSVNVEMLRTCIICEISFWLWKFLTRIKQLWGAGDIPGPPPPPPYEHQLTCPQYATRFQCNGHRSELYHRIRISYFGVLHYVFKLKCMKRWKAWGIHIYYKCKFINLQGLFYIYHIQNHTLQCRA